MCNDEMLASLGLEHAVVSLVGESSELTEFSQVDLKELEALSGVIVVEKPHSRRIHCDESRLEQHIQ